MTTLPLQFFRQLTDYNCGPASLQMALNFCGIEVTQDTLARLAHTTAASGTSRENMLTAARNYKVSARSTRGTWSAIRALIDQQQPVIVNYVESQENEGHYAVVIGYSPTAVRMHDPWHGENYRIALTTFMPRWAKRDHWLLTVLPPTPISSKD